jgi:bile acid:Na+ symporter, BASS family
VLRPRDIVLLIVIYASLLGGVLFPAVGAPFQSFPLYGMMSILFMSFLSIRLGAIWDTARKSALLIAVFLLIRMILLPACFCLFFRLVWPDYSLSALLLTGISTGVVAPFISNLLQANSPVVLVVVVVSSLLVPFTLPPLVEVLFGRSMEISLLAMMRLLFLVIFIPVTLAEIVRRVSASLLELVVKYQYYISLVLFALTNLGIFSKYSDFLYQQPMTIVAAVGASLLLSALYFGAGLIISWGRPIEDRLSAVISLAIMNNILVMVFSSQFFSAREPTVAAMYMIPFFGIILPLRAYRNLKTGT